MIFERYSRETLVKQAFQPSRLVRKRHHGFRARMATKAGRKVLATTGAPRAVSACQPNFTPRSEENRAMGRSLGRLKSREDYVAVAAARTKRVMPGFVLQALQRTDEDAGMRVSFTASRKVGNAVVRNRTKRRLRALAERVLPDCGLPDTDYVLIGRRETAALPFQELEQDLRKALATLKKSKSQSGQPTGSRDVSIGQTVITGLIRTYQGCRFAAVGSAVPVSSDLFRLCVRSG